MKTNTLVVNWHLTELCNYKCDYCYAKWDNQKKQVKDVFRESHKAIRILQELQHLLGHYQKQGEFQQLRINFAGGEPMLFRKDFYDVLLKAKEMDFETSIITNGSYIDEQLYPFAETLNLIGISLDSACDETNLKIGRAQNKRTLDLDRLHHINQLRARNSYLKIKINTVVNSYNCNEDSTPLIQKFSPSRWKVLKMLEVKHSNLSITDTEFKHFLDRHQSLQEIISVEDNDTMTQSYLMINPQGAFYQNGERLTDYDYSRAILDVGAIEALQDIQFDINKFKKRYESTLIFKQKVSGEY
ncbi:molybdenum cofactor biosynthesis protein A [Phocoenobacter uteri]|uniref:S-adenosylmethionine-dependent nucleotide dehydratase n=1 Tax=Phocoenobacter uteri TaxID=146806 RepID=A0A379C7A2_9PAST|nr:viperin family antiviral radical SAM protein [Phocoenobacter uteri]MDG6882102.1 hypothetical protein [Phocoenobacter uteri]SUB58252.1 molybdenum cofactor biosynthesis protein A [Phocoenobacter uteri]